DRTTELLPINRNPEDTASGQHATEMKAAEIFFAEPLQVADDRCVQALLDAGDLQVGSNNWVTSPRLSSSGHAMVVGDPHLDPRMLPGIMYAVGYVLPDARAVGANVPGIPGFTIGRTEHIATAVTNNYGDAQDLYIETIDPQNSQNYLEAGKSIPFLVERQTLKIKDKSAADGFRQEDFEVRLTSRGPVVSDVLGIKTDKLLSLRWAAAQNMQPQMGLTNLLTAKTVAEVDDALRTVTSIVLNFVFADTSGNIAWRATGVLPNRSFGGTAPVPIPSNNSWQDNWRGWIPFEEMPHQLNPQRGWLGTANHYTIESNYPHYYSDFASPSYRYRRLQQRMDEHLDVDHQATVDDHWSIQRDTKNLMAQSVTPQLVAALSADDRTARLADVLRAWDYHDDIDQSAPTVFQTVYSELAKATFSDELGEELAIKMLGNWYYWQERFESLVLDGTSHWFDDITTTEVTESMDQMIVRAGLSALERLMPMLGSDPAKWRWGDVHTLSFVNPLRRSGLGSGILGTGPLAAAGSGETLYRGWYAYDDPYHVISTAALRMVVDLGDNEKVTAVVAGGTVARTFHPHQ
ncbi:MAG TPA: penicillin acylase family protein, partial [Planctomycetaceae bacterium]|nr:penicillin acylase family protein [Planctomycetaceae bacterium]